MKKCDVCPQPATVVYQNTVNGWTLPVGYLCAKHDAQCQALDPKACAAAVKAAQDKAFA